MTRDWPMSTALGFSLELLGKRFSSPRVVKLKAYRAGASGVLLYHLLEKACLKMKLTHGKTKPRDKVIPFLAISFQQLDVVMPKA